MRLGQLAATKKCLFWHLLNVLKTFATASIVWIPRIINGVSHGLCKWIMLDKCLDFCNVSDIPPLVRNLMEAKAV